MVLCSSLWASTSLPLALSFETWSFISDLIWGMIWEMVSSFVTVCLAGKKMTFSISLKTSPVK